MAAAIQSAPGSLRGRGRIPARAAASRRLSAIIVHNAPLYPWAPQGWWATLGQYWADGSAEHRHGAPSYLDRDGLRGQYLSGVHDPSRIDPDNWVIDKALIDRPGVDEIMLDLLYDIPSNVPTFEAMQEFLRDRRPPTPVATGASDEISRKRSSAKSSPTTPTPNITRSRPATSRWRTTQPRSPP